MKKNLILLLNLFILNLIFANSPRLARNRLQSFME